MSVAPLRFLHFEIEMGEDGAPALLGRGGMGSTYRALDLHLRKRVVLKLIKEDLLENPRLRTRFYNEARAAARIEHPNVARVLYLSPPEASPCFFAMELIEGESLGKRIRRHGPMAPGEALLVLRGVADALIALSEHGLVHRDIKPDNLMVTKSGGHTRVKLIDFGLAKPMGTMDGFESVHTGEVFVGSLYFASPEQICAREQLDARSDFYSLGATLWHALTGFPPFTGTAFEVQQAHVFKDLPWEKVEQAPAPVSALLRRLLAKEPEERPANATQLLAEWDAALEALKSFGEEATVIGGSTPRLPMPAEPASGDGFASRSTQAETVSAPPRPPALPAALQTNAAPAPARRMPVLLWLSGGVFLLLLLVGAIGITYWLASTGPKTTALATPTPSPAPVPPPPALAQPSPAQPMPVPAPSATPAPEPAPRRAEMTRGTPITNKLGMRFFPVPITGGPSDGRTIYFSEGPTRLKEYTVFAKETKRYMPTVTIHQNGEHPVVAVTWDDAVAFCTWLSQREKRTYRLPTDHEWSCAVGIGDLEDASRPPSAKDGLIPGYPWGESFPPPAKFGNYGAGLRADSFEETSPVGSFPPNACGLVDIGGNVWEWCQDWMNPESRKERVQRGGSYFDETEWFARSSSRFGVVPSERNEYTGFRCVLELAQ